MRNLIKMTESDLSKIIKKVLRENEERGNRYMFFSNLQQMRRQCDLLKDTLYFKSFKSVPKGNSFLLRLFK